MEKVGSGGLDRVLSRAVVVWAGMEVFSTPKRSVERVIAEFGSDAVEILTKVRALEKSFYLSNSRFTVTDLESMGREASEEFQIIHPEISSEAVRALAWRNTDDYK